MLGIPKWKKKHNNPCRQGIRKLEKEKHILNIQLAKVFASTHKLFILYFAEEIRIVESIDATSVNMGNSKFATSLHSF